jgi:hypothetical protein
MKTRAVAVLLACFALATCAAAQMAGSRDLTAAWRAPRERVPAPRAEDCEHINSSITGPATDAANSRDSAGEGLALEIVGLAPVELQIGKDFIATVRLKNGGRKPVSIPWTMDGEQVERVSPDGGEEQYEVADISFRLESSHERLPIFLDSEGALFAQPENHESYLALEPGAWVELRVKASVNCGLENCLGTIQPDDRAVLSAWWYQRVLSHRVSGCEEKHGSHMVRQLDSAPFPVVVRAPREALRDGGLRRAALER